MTRIRWTAHAADQLEAIVNHIGLDNPEAARAVAQSILDDIGRLRTFPDLGRVGERGGTRELVSPPYVIVYRLHHDAAEVLYRNTAQNGRGASVFLVSSEGLAPRPLRSTSGTTRKTGGRLRRMGRLAGPREGRRALSRRGWT